MVAETAIGAGVGVAGAAVLGKTLEDDVDARLLTEIRDILVSIARYNERTRERTLYPRDLSAFVGIAGGIGRTFSADGALRGSHILISGGGAGDEYALRMGTSQVLRWQMGSTDPREIHIPMLITPGTQINIINLTDATDATWRAYLWYYADREDISARYK